MNKLEAAKLLTIASGFDRFVRADEVTATAWSLALANVDYPLAEKALVAHYSGDNAHKQLMPADIIKAVQLEARMTRRQIEEDVRSARAYGLVEKSWPDAQSLPTEVRKRLSEVRERVRHELLEQGQITPIEFRMMAERMGGAK